MLGAPQLLPDGETVLHSRTETSSSKIMVTSLKKNESRELFDGSFARYLETGHIIYGWENDLYAVPFDLNALKATGEPKLLVKEIMNTVYSWQYAFSNTGSLAYISGSRNAGQYSLANTPVWVDLRGNPESLPIDPGLYNLLKISPDGTQIAFTLGGAMASKILIYDLDRKSSRLFTSDSMGASPLWTIDGKQIAYTSDISAPRKIYLKAVNGAGKAEPIGSDYGRGVTDPFPSSWSKDGKSLVFMGFGFVNGSLTYDIGTLSIEGAGSYQPLLQEECIETEPKVSPDGTWLAYTSNESGQAEVYVRSYPVVAEGERTQVSTSGGHSPLWSLDSREIYYRNEDSVMAVKLQMGSELEPGKPEELFHGAYFPQPFSFMPISLNSWDIDPKGNRFLMIKLGQATGEESPAEIPHKINIVVNWFEELKDKVPAP
jgi:hypothetical protein